jgi:hypothetical protein
MKEFFTKYKTYILVGVGVIALVIAWPFIKKQL